MNIHNCGQAKKPRAAAACPLEIVPHEIKSNCYSNLRLLAGFLAGGVYANICPGRKKLKHEMAKAKRQTLSNCRRHPPAAGGGPEVEVEVEAEAEAFTRQQHPHQSQSQSQSQSEAPTSTQYQINTENKF